MLGLKLFKKNLLGILPEVRGKYTPNAKLAKYTWFGVGGPAEVLKGALRASAPPGAALLILPGPAWSFIR